MRRLAAPGAALLVVLLVVVGCSSGTAAPSPPPVATASASPPPVAVAPSSLPRAAPSSQLPAAAATPAARTASGATTVLAVGDIARCGSRGDERTAAIATSLLRDAPKAPVLALGDLAYPDGSRRDFARCFDPSWGRLAPHVRPVPGNHEYGTPGAAGYFSRFGPAAGPRGKGWYSFAAGSWHVVALNSNCDEVGCGPDSEQVRWLRSDLAQHRNRCTLAYWHHPRFSSGRHGGAPEVAALWSALDTAGADVVLNGHDHDYERFAPQGSDGRASAHGIREFVVGTGGAEHRAFAAPVRHSQKRISRVDAVLQLRLGDGGYGWALVGSAGAGRPLDAGTGTCS